MKRKVCIEVFWIGIIQKKILNQVIKEGVGRRGENNFEAMLEFYYKTNLTIYIYLIFLAELGFAIKISRLQI